MRGAILHRLPNELLEINAGRRPGRCHAGLEHVSAVAGRVNVEVHVVGFAPSWQATAACGGIDRPNAVRTVREADAGASGAAQRERATLADRPPEVVPEVPDAGVEEAWLKETLRLSRSPARSCRGRAW
jgi:hypothetical protein